ncbi:hypothetical protein NLI87_07910 [Metallosphaera sedula]|nr:hypothetical protein [Metallosphaera sedula]
MLVETCIQDPKLIEISSRLGFQGYIVESRKLDEARWQGVKKRLTLVGDSQVSPNTPIVFSKPLSRTQLVKVLNDIKIHGISLDNDNFYLLKKNLLNLAKSKGKYIEIRLNSSSSSVIRRAIEWGYKGAKVIFSSCASRKSELWAPLSLVNYLAFHGADMKDVITWVYTYPLELFKLVSDDS